MRQIKRYLVNLIEVDPYDEIEVEAYSKREARIKASKQRPDMEIESIELLKD